jgi:hypothetical protein
MASYASAQRVSLLSFCNDVYVCSLQKGIYKHPANTQEIRKTSTQMFLKFAELFEVCKAAELQLQALRCGQRIDHTAERRPVYHLPRCSEAHVAFYTRKVTTRIKKQRYNCIHMCTANKQATSGTDTICSTNHLQQQHRKTVL